MLQNQTMQSKWKQEMTQSFWSWFRRSPVWGHRSSGKNGSASLNLSVMRFSPSLWPLYPGSSSWSRRGRYSKSSVQQRQVKRFSWQMIWAWCAHTPTHTPKFWCRRVTEWGQISKFPECRDFRTDHTLLTRIGRLPNLHRPKALVGSWDHEDIFMWPLPLLLVLVCFFL